MADKTDKSFSEGTLLKLYELQLADLRMRHGAIWTEVQHYTWVLSIIVGFPFITYISNDKTSYFIFIFLIASSIFGAIFAIIVMIIIKRDFSYFTLSDSRVLYYEHQLGLTRLDGLKDSRGQRANSVETFNAAEDATKQNRFSLSWIRNLKMRFLILLVFFLYFCCATLMAIYFFIAFTSLQT